MAERILSTRDKKLRSQLQLTEEEQVADMMTAHRSIDELLHAISTTKRQSTKDILESELLNIQSRVKQSMTSSVVQQSSEPESSLQSLFNSIKSIFTK